MVNVVFGLTRAASIFTLEQYMTFRTFSRFTVAFGLLLFLPLVNLSAEEVTISVKPQARGSKGTMCFLVGDDGQPTEKKVIVRGFFVEGDQMATVHQLKVTTEGETMAMRGRDGASSNVPIYHLVSEGEAAPSTAEVIRSGVNTVEAEKEKYWLIDGDAAILIPKGWKITQGLTPPIQMAAEYVRSGIGFSALKELPADVGVTTIEEYAALKRELLQENFPDYKPSEPKAGKIGELPASFFRGPGTVEKVQGEIICMTVQGKEHLYLLLGILGQGSNEASRTELMRVMRSFKEKS